MSKRKPRGYWTLERCIEDAAQYSSRSEWQRSSSSAYCKAVSSGWMDQCCAHMASRTTDWTLELLIAKAAQYRTRGEWCGNDHTSYIAATRMGVLDQCCDHMVEGKKPNGHWTLERCIEDAAQYVGKKEWERASVSAYTTAHRNGWIEQCTEHMELCSGHTDNDVVYIWRDAGSDLHKVGVTSARVGEGRVGICSRKNDMDPRIVFMLKVPDARAVESQLLELGTDPELDSSIDGYTEFRRLTDAELGQAVSIAYEAALAA